MNLCINDFEGPLDLLLHLVKTAKMDIYTIDTKYIIDKYLEFISTLPKDDLDEASEYLVMASELIHLKSRLLLNLDDDTKEDNEFSINSEEDLKNKLLEYERYQNITGIFKELEEKRSEFYTKIPESLSEYIEKENIIEDKINPELLKEAMIELQKRMEYQKPVNTRITKREISVEERIDKVREFLNTRKKAKFTDLFEDFSKEVVVATFLAILDMCKNKEIKLTQKEAILEGLLFVVGDEGLTLDNICEIMLIDKSEAQELLKKLREEYNKDNRGIRISFIGESFKLTTKQEHKEYYQKLITTRGSNTLSQAALETLAIIAYNQPITRMEVDELRGISSINMIRKLMAKDLVKISGKSSLPGKPNLYRTTSEFLDYFGLATLGDLPDLPNVKNDTEEEQELFTIYKEN